MDVNKYASEIYAQNKAVGWWDNPDRCLFETLQLVSTEVAEGTEGERKDLNDDHLPERKMGEVELADALIRTLDLGGHCGWEYVAGVQGRQDYAGWSVGRRHLHINEAVVDLARNMRTWPPTDAALPRRYSALVDRIVWVSETFGYDIEGAMREKLAYNAKRADHKRENRAKAHGKRF